MPRRTDDLTGQKFGRLTVLGRGEDFRRKDGRHNATFVCHCDCGNLTTVIASHLKNGNTKSCGCIHKEFVASINKSHGKTETRLYRIWLRMKQRCNNKHTACYEYYGARGIAMCREWADDFHSFETWAKSAGYNDTLTIDRIDVNGAYCPKNCRWVSRKTQANNMRSNRYITYNDKTQTLSQWSDETGLNRQTITTRLDKLGWSVEDALTKPNKHQTSKEKESSK